MVEAGQALAHLLQPTQIFGFTSAYTSVLILIACNGQVFTQTPQATQYWVLTKAFFLGFEEAIEIILSLMGSIS